MKIFLFLLSYILVGVAIGLGMVAVYYIGYAGEAMGFLFLLGALGSCGLAIEFQRSANTIS